MVKNILFIALLVSNSIASTFEENCIKCHEASNIPDIVIYKRYLLKYSNNRRIKNAIVKYLKNPSKDKSIMPHQFIDKFGFKKPTQLSDKELKLSVEEFIKRHDLKKKLYIQPSF